MTLSHPTQKRAQGVSSDGDYVLPPLGYALDALEPEYSAEMLELHYKKHHQAYVDGANKTLASLAEAREGGEYTHLPQLQKDLAFHTSGHVMHSMFWSNMAPDNREKPDDHTTLAIKTAFGGIDALRDQFLSAGAAIQGSGWAALTWESIGQRLLVEQIHDHQDNRVASTVPILVMDMWEHAYYLQYRNEKKRWTKAFWELVNWSDVNTRLFRVQNTDLTGVDANRRRA